MGFVSANALFDPFDPFAPFAPAIEFGFSGTTAFSLEFAGSEEATEEILLGDNFSEGRIRAGSV
jgi:hypothetical protein